MVQRWPEGSAFMEALQRVDGDDYETATKNFRNRASHALAPRFTLGHVQTVTRYYTQATEMVRQAGGGYQLTPVPEKMQPSYGFGGTPPLDMDSARSANLAQFETAERCFYAYVALLRVATSGMRRKDEQPAQASSK